MNGFTERLHSGRMLIGMVHVGAMPGTPRACETVRTLAERAAGEARVYHDAGFDAVMIENMHDVPYLRRHVGPEIVAGMTVAAEAVRDAIDLPIGIQILAGDNQAALAIAHAADLSFIRAEGFVFASVADEGVLDEADAGPLLRYRKAIGAESIAILADVRKKHSAHALTQDLDIAQHVRAAAFFGADAAVLSGTATGDAVRGLDIEAAAATGALPIIIGSGAEPDALPALFSRAAAVIVGTFCKEDGDWERPVDLRRATQMVLARDTVA